MSYAGFWKRAMATIIDGVILYIVSIIVFAIVATVADSYMLDIFRIVISWLYHAILESSNKQATFGKMVLSIKVTDLSGNKIGFRQASGRFFGMFFSTLSFGVGFLMAGFTPKKQALHDRLAKCLVINQYQGGALLKP